MEGEDGEVLAAGAEIDELFAREEELAQCRHAVLGEAERPTHGQQASWGELTAVVMKFHHVIRETALPVYPAVKLSSSAQHLKRSQSAGESVPNIGPSIR